MASKCSWTKRRLWVSTVRCIASQAAGSSKPPSVPQGGSCPPPGAATPLARQRVADAPPDTVVRTWAFGELPANGNPKTPALQVAPGVYNEAMFKSLDRVVFEAGKRGLRLLLSLSNSWDAYGGAPAYLSWAAAAGETFSAPAAPDASPFFSSPHCKATFKAFMATLLNRINTFSGVAYKDDPAIFAFDLMNEPRVPADPSGATLGAWIEEMAAYFKSIDHNHMLTTGAEGFFGPSTPDLVVDNPSGDNGTGHDFVAHHSLQDIDFATIHVWPDQWLQCCTVECLIPFLDRWVAGHIAASDAIGKPLMVEEFGAKMRCFPHGQSSSVSGMSAGSTSQTTRRLAGRKSKGAVMPVPMSPPPPALPPPASPSPAAPPPSPPPMAQSPPPQPVASPPPAPPPTEQPPPPSPPPAATAPPLPPSKPPTPPQLLLRTEMYKMIYSRGASAVAAGRAWGGSLFWLLGVEGEPDADHYTVYIPQDAGMATLIAEHVSDMRLHENVVTATPLASSMSTSTKP